MLKAGMLRAVLVGFVMLAGGAATAQTVAFKPDEIIATRQAGMALTGGISDAMKVAVAAGTEPKQFEEASNGLVKWAAAFPALFPEGTQTGRDTKAKPEIWTDRANFEKAAVAFGQAAQAVGAATKANDKAGFATAYAEMGKTCGGCHRPYKNR